MIRDKIFYVFSAIPALLQCLLWLKTGVFQEIKTIELIHCFYFPNELALSYHTGWVLLDVLLTQLMHANSMLTVPLIVYLILGFTKQENDKKALSRRKLNKTYKDYNGYYKDYKGCYRVYKIRRGII